MKLVLLLSSTLFLCSCAHQLVGKWNVDNYETKQVNQAGVALRNIGTLTFDRAGTGTKKLDYTVLGIEVKDSLPFVWTWGTNDNFVAIDSGDSDLTKTWIIIENSKKVQKWKATDGANTVQILELTKLKK